MISQIADRAEFFSFLNKTYTTKSKKPLLKTLIFNVKIIPEELVKIVRRRHDLKEKYELFLRVIDENMFSLLINKRNNGKSIGGYVIIDTSKKGLWILTTIEKSYFVNFVVETLFKKLYPNISHIYLNTTQMKYLIKELKDKYMNNVFLNYISANIRSRPNTLGTLDYRKGTVQRWKVGTEDELNDLLQSYRVMVKSLSFKILDENHMLLYECYISKTGTCKLQYGFYSDFYNEVVNIIIKIGYNLKVFFSNRERYKKNGQIELFPVQIKYNIYFNKIQLSILENTINNKYLTSTIYSGNPYYAANISDYDDGSSFGLTVLKNKVTITPIVKASPESIWKLTNVIQETLGDGDVVNVLR